MRAVKKTLLSVLLCISVIVSCLVITNAAVNTAVIDGLTENINAVTVYDLTAGKLIYEKNASQRIYIASTTKLVTCLVALKYVDPETVFAVGSELSLVKPHSSLCGLNAASGHTLKLRTLIAAMLLPSGNDAAYTVAVNVARSISGNSEMSDADAVNYFCSLMNSYCREIGCTGTNFVNPEGWDNSNHYSTAADMTKIAVKAAENPVITSLSSISSEKFYFASGHNITWKNTNELLDPESPYYYPYASGLKTGTTYMAGKCLIAFAEKEGRRVLITAFGAESEDDRFGRVRDIFEYVYSPIVKGDADNNGEITAADARLVLRASVDLEEKTAFLLQAGDYDLDGNLTASDARMILRTSVGLPASE